MNMTILSVDIFHYWNISHLDRVYHSFNVPLDIVLVFIKDFYVRVTGKLVSNILGGICVIFAGLGYQCYAGFFSYYFTLWNNLTIFYIICSSKDWRIIKPMSVVFVFFSLSSLLNDLSI